MDKSWPRALATSMALMLILVAAGCEEPGDGPGDGPGDTPETVDTVVVTQDTEPVFYALRGGRYRVGWTHRCGEIGLNFQHADGTSVFERTARSQTFSAIVSNVPAGEYQLVQTLPECEQYEIRIDRM